MPYFSFNPSYVSDISLWLDADDDSTITIDTGVSIWEDKSGNENDATQSTSSYQPTINTGSLNGKNTVLFSGLSQKIIWDSLEPHSYLSVCKWTDALGSYRHFINFFHGHIDGSLIFSSVYCPAGYGGSAFVNGIAALGSALPRNTSWEILDVIPLESETYSIEGTGAQDGFPTRAFYGEIAEIIIFDVEPSTENRQKIEGYLAHKWALTSGLAIGHPYKTEEPTIYIPTLSEPSLFVMYNALDEIRCAFISKNSLGTLIENNNIDNSLGDEKIFSILDSLSIDQIFSIIFEYGTVIYNAFSIFSSLCLDENNKKIGFSLGEEKIEKIFFSLSILQENNFIINEVISLLRYNLLNSSIGESTINKIISSFELLTSFLSFKFIYGVDFLLEVFNKRNSLGENVEFKNLFGITDSYNFLIKNQYGTYLENFLSVLNEVKGVYEDRTSAYTQALNNILLINDPLSSNQLIKSTFELLTSKQDLFNIITKGFDGYLSIINQLNLNDPLSSNQLIKSTFELLISNDLIKNIISEGINNKQSIVNTLSTSIERNQKIINDISNLSGLLKNFLIKGSIYELPTKFYSYDVKVYLDGINISSMVSSDITIEKDQRNIHNSISFSSISEVLFNKANPSILEGQIRIEVQIDSSVMYFLLEERSFTSDGTVSYWGRDATARDNSPWSNSMNVILYEWQSAKDLVESLVDYSAIDWEIFDWQLPNTFEATGTPVEIISIIASEIGAIVRAQDDGSLCIRYPYPIRPVDIKTSQSVYSYSSDIVYGESFSEENGDWYNQVTVTADTNDKTAPQLELEDVVDGERIIGTTSYVRAFYYEDPEEAPSITSQDITDGFITFIKKDVEEITEIITFSNGSGSSSYPLKTRKSVSWLGRENTILTWNEYSTDITLETEDYCLAEITYDSEYHRYKASGHNVEELLTIFEIESTYYSSILVKTDSIASIGDKEGDEITTSYLTEEFALVKRGENWIDDNKYNIKIISFNSSYISTVKDGDVIWLDIGKIPSGNYQVISNGIIINGPKVINNMTVKQWEV